jgi:hypothetical protein
LNENGAFLSSRRREKKSCPCLKETASPMFFLERH